MKKKKLELIADPGLFLEYAQADASSRLDRENAVLHGVKILGFVSLNGRRYTVEALERACALYENAKVNVNHPRHSPQAPRDYQDRIGNIRNVRFQKNEGLYADFHFNPRHPLAEQLMWDAEHAPENVGFSHNIAAKTATQKDGSLLVEEILLVRSVDLVADPATTHGLFESQGACVCVGLSSFEKRCFLTYGNCRFCENGLFRNGASVRKCSSGPRRFTKRSFEDGTFGVFDG